MGRKGDSAILSFPSRTPLDFIVRSLPWDLLLSVVSAPCKPCICACPYRLKAPENLPTEVPFAFTRTTVMLTIANPAAILRRLRSRKELLPRWTYLWSTSVLQSSENHIERKLTNNERTREKCWEMLRESRKSTYAHALGRPVIALSVWLLELLIQILIHWLYQRWVDQDGRVLLSSARFLISS